MTEEQYIVALKNNPHGIRNIPNPTEGMQLACVEENGMLLQYIKNPSERVIEQAIQVSPRAIQFVANPSESLLISLVERDWAILEYISDPSDAVIETALDQSGWAIRYIKNPTESMQLKAVRQNYDALQYIANPSEVVQLEAVKNNYLALRFIANPAISILQMAVRNHPQALRQISHITKEMAIQLLEVTSLILGYVPQQVGLSKEDVQSVFVRMVAKEDVDEQYVRELMGNKSIGGRQSSYPIDVLSLIDQQGSRKAKQIAIDEFLVY